jgi:antirestriction protein ArdC
MLLSYGGEYATFNQIKKAGGSVLKGEHATVVYFAKEVSKELDDGTKDSYYYLTGYPVFRIGSQTTGIEPKYRNKWENGGLPSDTDACMMAVREYCNRVGIKLLGGGAEAFYTKSDDCVQVPGIDSFPVREQYFHTLFHELVHSSGHPDRLNRLCHDTWGDSNYATEELVADIGACLCLGRLGLDTTKCIKNTASYVASWRKRISNFKPQDFSECVQQAERACDYIFNTQNKEANNG